MHSHAGPAGDADWTKAKGSVRRPSQAFSPPTRANDAAQAAATLAHPSAASMGVLQRSIGNAGLTAALNRGRGGTTSTTGANAPTVQRAGGSRRSSRSYYEEPPEYDYTDVSYIDRDYLGRQPTRRHPSQNSVMNNRSAARHMRDAGVHPGGPVSHLHLAAAYSHGDPVYGTPQRASNLAPGTDGTNLSHRRYEYANSGHQAPMVDVPGSPPSYQSSRVPRYATPVDMHGIPITQAGMSRRVGRTSIYRDMEYSMRSPHEPLNSEPFSARLDPFDTRSAAERERRGELPHTNEIRRQAQYAAARQVVSGLDAGVVPEYDDWEQDRLRRRSSRSSRSPSLSPAPRPRYRRRDSDDW
ncbi:MULTISPECIES: hypothetical protein [unclassified Streptomyces]|uniref:hypothetical protein n=1 Tax=unclassified Streptomyces TaxID=2593676 RepID=UPI003244F4BF